MDAIQNKSVTEAALRQAEDKLLRLEQMQARIGDADFGICVRCKQPIPIGRLMLMPHATRCVRCSG
jgi:DnaK suppressor protein